MDKNIVSFIESIEPDFSYQGTEGALNFVIESNENMLVIESYLDSVEEEAIQEGLYSWTKEKVGSAYNYGKEKGGKAYTWAKENVKKAIDYIIKAIKVAIAKIKGIFFTMVRKVQVLYAQATKKIADMIASVGKSDKTADDQIELTYTRIKTEALNTKINSFIPENTEYFKGLESNSRAADEKTEVNSDDIIKACLGDNFSKEDFRKDCLSESSGKVRINAVTGNLKTEYDEDVMKPLKALYDRIMNNKKSMLSTVSKLRTADGITRHQISYANKVVNAINAASAKFFNAVFSVVVTGFHSYIKAAVFAVRHRIARAGSDAYAYGKEKAIGAKDAVVNGAKSAKDYIVDKLK